MIPKILPLSMLTMQLVNKRSPPQQFLPKNPGKYMVVKQSEKQQHE